MKVKIKRNNSKGLALFDLLVTLMISSIISVTIFGIQIKANKRSHEVFLRSQMIKLTFYANEVLRENAKEGGELINKNFVPSNLNLIPSCGFTLKPCDKEGLKEERINTIQSKVNELFPYNIFQGKVIACISSKEDAAYEDGGNYRVLSILSRDEKSILNNDICPKRFIPPGGIDDINVLLPVIFEENGKTRELIGIELYSRMSGV